MDDADFDEIQRLANARPDTEVRAAARLAVTRAWNVEQLGLVPTLAQIEAARVRVLEAANSFPDPEALAEGLALAEALVRDARRRLRGAVQQRAASAATTAWRASYDADDHEPERLAKAERAALEASSDVGEHQELAEAAREAALTSIRYQELMARRRSP